MKFTPKQLEKAKNAASAEELLALAKEENVEMTAEEASKLFDMLHSEGDLPDEALDDVAGGCDHGGYETNLWRKSVYFWDHVGKNDAVAGQKYAITLDDGTGWGIGEMVKSQPYLGNVEHIMIILTCGGDVRPGHREFLGSTSTLYKHAKDYNTGEILL